MSVAVGEPAVVGDVPKLLLIGGEWREADSGARLAGIDEYLETKYVAIGKS